MADYKITGIWKDANKTITHYAVHTQTTSSHTRASKMTKAEVIRLLETPGNKAFTWKWNYQKCFWEIGEPVKIVNGSNGKYLRTDPDNSLTDNLAHLINYDWLFS